MRSCFGLTLSVVYVVVLLASPDSSVAAASKYPDAHPGNASDMYFGTEVADPYRWMEQADTAPLTAYLKAQDAATHALFGTLAQPHAQLLQRIRQLQRGTATVRLVARVGDRYFFLETPSGAAAAHLAMRAVGGGKKRVLLDPERFGMAGGHPSIDFFSPSNDGRYVAVTVSHGGGEDWVLRFLDVASGRLLPDQIGQLAEPFPRWTADGRAIYYPRLQTLAPGAAESAKLDDIRVYRHLLGTDVSRDEAVFGAGVLPQIAVAKVAFPSVSPTEDGRFEIASVSRGTEEAKAFWIRDLTSPASTWRQVADYDDKVAIIAEHDGHLYGINQKKSYGQVIVFDALRGSAAEARVVIDDPVFVIATETGDLAAAGDALYVSGMHEGRSVIRRIAYAEGATPRDLALPSDGSLIEFTAAENLPGFSFALQSPTLSPRIYRFEPQGDAFADTGLYVADPADFSRIVTREVEFDSSDGARVPMTITLRRDLVLDGSHPTLMTVYGAYGAIVPMWFSAPNLAWYERGGILAHVHARGGGEKGEAWHQDAMKTRKQHTIDDVIAAAHWLIDAKYTSPAHLAVAGKSAGGIPAAGAVVQHPELFAAALIRVGVTDLLRLEQGSLGPANTLEFGSVANEDEFRAMRALSPYANIREATAYPAVMLETGIHDPRVPSWQLAKMTARLQAATSSKRPIVLRVDYDAGHGLGSDKAQIAALLADEYTFLGWQLGMSGFPTQ